MAIELQDNSNEWIGNTPKSWSTLRIGEMFSERATKVSDEDYAPLSVTKRGVIPQVSTAAKSDDHSNRKLVLKGDFAINSRSDRRNSCGFAKQDGSVSLINIVLSPKFEIEPRYFDYLFDTVQFSEEFYMLGHGIVSDLWTTRWVEMKRISVPVPSLDEQKRIARYLDTLADEIDKAIAAAEASIGEYHTYKKALIFETVTKGLDKTVEMKDNGIGWVGDVPESWSTLRIGEMFSERSTKVSDEDYAPLSVTKKGVLPQLLTAAKSDDHSNRKLVLKGDFAINSRSDRRNSCGFAKNDGSVSLINIVLSPKFEIEPRYFDYLFDTVQFSEEFYTLGHGIVSDLWTTRWIEMKRISVPVPSLPEQKIIADYLDSSTHALASIISAKNGIIAELKAYKKSLIFEVTTGKREIPCQ